MRRASSLVPLLVAAVIFLGCIISPPSLMDDVDSVQAQIARNMLQSGDWVTARLDGIKYLEKSPLKYWMIAVSYMIFGVHDWAARIPIAIATVLLCWVMAKFGAWAFGDREGMYAGLILATCVGIFLFTRILLPDVILTLTITVAMWGLLRVLDAEEATSGTLGDVDVGGDGNRIAVEGTDRGSLPGGVRVALSGTDAAIAGPQDVATGAAIHGDAGVSGDCGSVARAGYTA